MILKILKMGYPMSMIYAKTLYRQHVMFLKIKQSGWSEVFCGCISKISSFFELSNFKPARAAGDTGDMQ